MFDQGKIPSLRQIKTNSPFCSPGLVESDILIVLLPVAVVESVTGEEELSTLCLTAEADTGSSLPSDNIRNSIHV